MNITCTHQPLKTVSQPLQSLSSLSFVMSFQPSMWDDKTIQSALNYTTHIIEIKLKNNYSNECTKNMLGRLHHIFNGLNFNTHRKSIAVLIAANAEKVLYLNFPVRLFVSTGNLISILDLVTNIKKEIGFYLLFIVEGSIQLYEYYNKHLNKVYEQKAGAEVGYCVGAGIRASTVISQLNTNYLKPVFIVGSREEFISFQSAVSYPEIVFQIKPPVQCSKEIAQKMVSEIVGEWNLWLSKFDMARIAMAKKANALVYNYGAVLQALCNSVDGLILMDKRVKKELQKPASGDLHFQDSKFFMSQIEKFVDRGNCIQIKENGLLKNLGGIVLLPDTLHEHYNKLSFGGERISGEISNLF